MLVILKFLEIFSNLNRLWPFSALISPDSWPPPRSNMFIGVRFFSGRGLVKMTAVDWSVYIRRFSALNSPPPPICGGSAAWLGHVYIHYVLFIGENKTLNHLRLCQQKSQNVFWGRFNAFTSFRTGGLLFSLACRRGLLVFTTALRSSDVIGL